MYVTINYQLVKLIQVYKHVLIKKVVMVFVIGIVKFVKLQ